MILWIILGIWLFYVAIIFPIRTNSTLSDLKNQIRTIEHLINSKKKSTASYKKSTNLIVEQVEPLEPEVTEPMVQTQHTVKKHKKSTPDLERQIGTRLPVWVGSISLVFAAFYMIQYSIELGLLSPAVRLTMSSIFGVVLMLASLLVTRQKKFPNGKRIGQGLAGAGIAVLYLSIYAATNLYEFLDLGIGFLGMASVTAISIIWSLKHGLPIALMGLLSGFLTPILLKGEPNTNLIFIYLYIVLLGSFWVIKKNNWWNLASVAIIGSFLWAFSWASIYPLANNSLALGLFVLFTSATFIAMCNENTPTILKKTTTLLALIFLSYIANANQYGYQEWGMYALLALTTIILASREPETYKSFTWFALIMLILMIYSWGTSEITEKLVVISGFGLLFTISGYLMGLQKNKNNISWLQQSAAANVIFFILFYIKIKNYSGGYTWSYIAISCAIFWAFSAWLISSKFKSNKKTMAELFSISFMAVVAFTYIAIMTAFDLEFYAIGFATELLAISWLSTKIKINKFDNIAIITILAIVCALFYQYINKSFTFHELPMIYYGIPVTLLTISGILFRGRILEFYVQTIEVMSIILLIFMGAAILAHILKSNIFNISVDHKYLLNGLQNNYYLLLGLTCIIWGWNKYKRPAYELSGYLLITICCTNILIHDMFFSNLLSDLLFSFRAVSKSLAIGSTPIFNSLLLPYALPALWIGLAQKYLRPEVAKLLIPFTSFLLFIWVTLTVRQYFHGSYLTVGETSNLEVYMYSIMWLVFGLSLLILGALFENKEMRIGSLLIVVAAIFKVFMYDAAELTGILRVISFLGLGLSLIAIGWFYARFVFRKA